MLYLENVHIVLYCLIKKMFRFNLLCILIFSFLFRNVVSCFFFCMQSVPIHRLGGQDCECRISLPCCAQCTHKKTKPPLPPPFSQPPHMILPAMVTRELQNIFVIHFSHVRDRKLSIDSHHLLPLSLDYPKRSADDRFGHFSGCVFYKHNIFSLLYQLKMKKKNTAGKSIQFPVISYSISFNFIYNMYMYWISIS